jgi:cytochrome c553
MHDSSGGAAAVRGKPQFIGNAFLLLASDPSSTCLTCHANLTPGGANVLTPLPTQALPPGNYTPGGDFGWLQRSWSWMGATAVEVSPGERHGHNVVAADYGLLSDATFLTAPGGTYPSSQLTCVSCHDPHGRFRYAGTSFPAVTGAPIVASGSYGGTGTVMPTPTQAVGSYRLLAGQGYAPPGVATTFNADPPVALAPVTYNQGEGTAQVRVAYGSGMSEWCRSCHGTLHDGSTTSGSPFEHPSGNAAKLGSQASVYNQYVATGTLTGLQATSYWSIVPYEEGTTDRATLAAHATSDGSARSGPSTGQENVMCLSCHRAHASGWDSGLRWNMRDRTISTGYVTVAGQWPGLDAAGDAALPANAQGRTQAETRGAMYDRDPSSFAPYQKALCNKCHAQDGP